MPRRVVYPDAELNNLFYAVRDGQVARVRRILRRAPDLLRRHPEESAELLALAISAIGAASGVTLVTPFLEAGARLAEHRELFDLLVASGACCNPPSGALASPLHSSAQLSHPFYLIELLRLGADRSFHIRGKTPASYVRDRIARDGSAHGLARDQEFLRALGEEE